MAKRVLLIAALLLFAGLALSPVLVMVSKTVFVETVEISDDQRGPDKGEGYTTGVVREARPDSASETALKIDVDVLLTSPYTTADRAPFRSGEKVFFSPPYIYYQDDPGQAVVLFHETPTSRSALWDRAVVVKAESSTVILNVERMSTLVVPNERAGDLTPGMHVRYQTGKRFSLAAYGNFLSDKRRMGLLWNTLLVALLTVFVATVVGVVFALAIAKLDTPCRGLLAALYIVPLLIPPYITAIAWTQILGQAGVLTALWRDAFGGDKPPISIYGVPGSVLTMALTYFPIVTLLTVAGLKNVQAEMEEAAVLAAGKARTLWHVTLRSVAPYVFSGMVFVLVFTLSNSAAPFLLRLQLFSGQVLVAFQTDLSGAEAMTVGVPMIVLALAAVVFQGWVENRRSRTALARQVRTGYVMEAGPWGWAVLAFCCLVLLLAVVAPLSILVYNTGAPVNVKRALLEMGGEIKTSLWTAAAAATLALAIGGYLGYLAARWRSGKGTLVDVFVMIPYAAPAAVLGVGLIEIFNQKGILGAVYTSEAILIWAFLLRFLPFAVKPVTAAIRAVPFELEEAARVHGVGRLRTAWLVFRLGGRGFAAAWILVFILSLGELDAALLVHPAGLQTVPIRIFNAIHFGHIELVSALCLVLIFLIVLPLALYTLVTARKMELA